MGRHRSSRRPFPVVSLLGSSAGVLTAASLVALLQTTAVADDGRPALASISTVAGPAEPMPPDEVWSPPGPLQIPSIGVVDPEFDDWYGPTAVSGPSSTLQPLVPAPRPAPAPQVPRAVSPPPVAPASTPPTPRLPTPGAQGAADPTDPAQPTDPTDPTDPVDPTQPTDPTDPTEPADPTDPADPTHPADPADPTDPAQPTDPTDPTDPAQPTDPTDPTDPAQPTDPTDPADPPTCGPEVSGGEIDPLPVDESALPESEPPCLPPCQPEEPLPGDGVGTEPVVEPTDPEAPPTCIEVPDSEPIDPAAADS